MVKISKRWLKQIIKETASAATPRRKPFGELSYGVGTGAHIEDEEGNIYLIIDVRQKLGSYRPVRVIKNVATGKVRNLPVEEYYRSFYPVADPLKEGTHKKLIDDMEKKKKISKRQLKQIIKEEKQKLITETKIRQTIRRVIKEAVIRHQPKMPDVDKDILSTTVADLEEITQGMNDNQKIEYLIDFLNKLYSANKLTTDILPLDALKWIATNFEDEEVYGRVRRVIGTPRYARRAHDLFMQDRDQEVHDILQLRTDFAREAEIVAFNPNTPEEVLLQLLDAAEANGWDKVKSAIVKNPNIPTEMLEEFAEEYPVRIAEHPNTPEEVIRALASHESPYIRKLIANRPDTPPDVLTQLASDPDRKDKPNSWSVRRTVATNPNTPPAVLEQLAQDRRNKYIRIEVAKNPSASEDTLKYLLNDGVATVRKKAEMNLRKRA